MNKDRICVRENSDTLVTDLVQHISENIQELENKKTISLLLSGGTTPKKLYELLSKDTKIDWKRVHIFLADERYVPLTSEDSNYLMIQKALQGAFLLLFQNIHPVVTIYKNPEESAREYEKKIVSILGKNFLFDVVLLGIGEDAHTCSLFPGQNTLKEKKRLVLPVFNSPKPPQTRITLTFPAINRASHVYVLATGSSKARALKQIFDKDTSVDKCPAKGIRPVQGILEWWIDKDAAALL